MQNVSLLAPDQSWIDQVVLSDVTPTRDGRPRYLEEAKVHKHLLVLFFERAPICNMYLRDLSPHSAAHPKIKLKKCAPRLQKHHIPLPERPRCSGTSGDRKGCMLSERWFGPAAVWRKSGTSLDLAIDLIGNAIVVKDQQAKKAKC